MKQIPVILHTDIGGDIDDTWALIMMLKQHQLAPRMIFTDTDNPVYRAAICAKLLEHANRTEIELAAGIVQWPERHPRTQYEWIRDYRLADYPGRYSYDGISRFLEFVTNADEPVTLISIGPTPSLAEALRRKPEIAQKIHFVGMFGSIRRQHRGREGAIAEYNVEYDVKACQTVFRAPWKSAVITPLDTCGCVVLENKYYRRIEDSNDPSVRDIVENYRIWKKAYGREGHEPLTESSILYDTVAVHLASSTEFLEMKPMNLVVDDRGFTVEDDRNGMPFNVAMDWNDLEGYKQFLTETLLS